MAYTIKPWRDADIEHLPELVRGAIARIGSCAYSPAQLAARQGRQPDASEYRRRLAAGATILVATDSEDRAVSYFLIELDGHIDRLYCHPDHARNGLAAMLLATAEVQARNWGTARLYTEASELARPVFERAGFSVIVRRDFAIDGVPIHNWAMEKRLS